MFKNLVIAWGTTRPKVCCVIDLINGNYQGTTKTYVVKSYSKEEFIKYSLSEYTIVSKSDFEAAHGKIEYP